MIRQRRPNRKKRPHHEGGGRASDSNRFVPTIHQGLTKRIARGAGSIFVDSDVRQLLNQGDFDSIKAANKMIRLHAADPRSSPIKGNYRAEIAQRLADLGL